MTPTLALTEMTTALIVVAIIGAIPPTVTGIVTLVVLRAGQKRNAQALDGKLTQLMDAEKGVSRAEGAAQERIEERGRSNKPRPVTVENTPESPAIVTAVKPPPQKLRAKHGKGRQR